MRRTIFGLLLVTVACGGSDEPVPPLAFPPERGCEAPVRRPDEGAAHIPDGQPPFYRTEPPTSGPHFRTWARTGVYDEPAPDGNVVHNLEHGHVVIWHSGLSSEQLSQLRSVAAEQPQWVIVMPRAMTDVKVALTAWRTFQRCVDVPEDLAAFARAFFSAHARRAPEEVPGQAL